MSQLYVAIETIGFAALTVALVSYMYKKEKVESETEPYKPPAEDKKTAPEARSAFDRVTRQHRPLLQSGIFFNEIGGFENITTNHYTSALQDRTLDPAKRAAYGEHKFSGVGNRFRQEAAHNRLLKGGQPQYYKLVEANS